MCPIITITKVIYALIIQVTRPIKRSAQPSSHEDYWISWPSQSSVLIPAGFSLGSWGDNWVINVQMVASLAELWMMRHSDAIASSSIAFKPITTSPTLFRTHSLTLALTYLSQTLLQANRLSQSSLAPLQRVCVGMCVSLYLSGDHKV